MSETALKLVSNPEGPVDLLPEGWEWRLYEPPATLEDKVRFMKDTRGVPKHICAEGVWMATPKSDRKIGNPGA